MENITSLLELYKTITHEDSIHVGAEYEILSIISSELNWLLLTDEEKQAKRVGILKKVSFRLDDGMKNTFLLEETVNMVYLLCVETIKIIDQRISEVGFDKLLFRLKAMLIIEKILINEHFEAKRIRSFNYPKLDNVFNEIINSDQHKKLYDELNLGLLKEKVHLKYRLLNTQHKNH